MKLDKMKFAQVIAYLGRIGCTIGFDEIADLDNLIDINVEPVSTQFIEVSKVDELLRQLNAPNGFIPAIKAYRVLTGAGLKESKEAIERYRSIPKFTKKDEPATLSDILGDTLKERRVNFDKFEG